MSEYVFKLPYLGEGRFVSEIGERFIKVDFAGSGRMPRSLRQFTGAA